MRADGNPFSEASVTFSPPTSCSPEKATMAWYGLFLVWRYSRMAWKYRIARSTPLVTTIALASPPIRLWAMT